MKSRWMVCAFVVLIGCNNNEPDNSREPDARVTGGSGGMPGSGGEGGAGDEDKCEAEGSMAGGQCLDAVDRQSISSPGFVHEARGCVNDVTECLQRTNVFLSSECGECYWPWIDCDAECQVEFNDCTDSYAACKAELISCSQACEPEVTDCSGLTEAFPCSNESVGASCPTDADREIITASEFEDGVRGCFDSIYPLCMMDAFPTLSEDCSSCYIAWIGCAEGCEDLDCERHCADAIIDCSDTPVPGGAACCTGTSEAFPGSG